MLVRSTAKTALAVRVRVNDGAETGPAGDEKRSGGHGTAVRSAKRPLNGPRGQLRQQSPRNESHIRKQNAEPADAWETTAIVGAR